MAPEAPPVAPALGSGPWWEAVLRAITKGFTLRGVDVCQAVIEITRDEAGGVPPAVVMNVHPLDGALVRYDWPGLESLMFGRAPTDGPSGSVDMWKQIHAWPAHGDCKTPAEVAWAWAWAPGHFDDGTPKPCPIERELADMIDYVLSLTSQAYPVHAALKIISNGPPSSADLSTGDMDHAAGTSLAAPTTAAGLGGAASSPGSPAPSRPEETPPTGISGRAGTSPSPPAASKAVPRPTERPDPSTGAGPAGLPAASGPAVTSEVSCPKCGAKMAISAKVTIFPRDQVCAECKAWSTIVRKDGVVMVEGNPLAAAMPAPAPMPGTLFGDVAPTKPKRKRTTKASPKPAEHAPEEA